VLVSSLPAALQQRYRELLAAETGAIALRDDPDANTSRNFIWQLIASAAKHRFASPERSAAIREITSRTYLFPGDTGPRTVSAVTLRRWLRRYGRDGQAGLQKRARRDRGKRHGLISLRWNRATVELPELVRQDIAEQLRMYVRGLFKAGESGVSLQRLATFKLCELTSKAGYRGGELGAVCRVPRAFIDPERVYARVHQFRTDRKSYMDHAAPRIMRTRAGQSPMDLVVGDIHPVDILVRREDGSVATFRAIAWLDLATNRMWMDLVLLAKGEGIRNAHVIASFRHMIDAWGAPRGLYLDNGSEYNWAPFIDDALKLIDRASGRPLIGEIGGFDRLSQIVRALPYNASAKPIEGIFAILERNHFSRVPGWIGGDRMRKKSANVGQEPDPFPGTADECRALILSALDYYHNTPQRGSLNGRAPNGALADAIAAGWGMVAVDPDAFAIAFSAEERRTVQQGRIRHAGTFWTCPEIIACQRDAVVVRIPKYEDWARLPIFSEAGELVGFAEPDIAYGFLDGAGAVDAHARRKAHRGAVIALSRSAPEIDPLAERAKLLGSQPPAASAPIVATVGASADATRIAAGLRETPRQRRARREREIDLNQAEALRLAEKRRRMVNQGN
jgi:hypothetical protein